jgi:flagellar biosynthetic protein FlhB
MADEGGEKTEDASDKKIDDSRKQGQVWKSKDLTGVFVFLVGLGIVKGTWGTVEEKVNGL